MLELSKERIEEILHKETPGKEEPATILRGIYNRYRHLYEKYFADMDALNDDEIAELRKYHEETKSLVKYYYMDIPQDVCIRIHELEEKYSANLLGPNWREYLSGSYREFKEKNHRTTKGEENVRVEFAKQALAVFYEIMDYVFRDGFGTGSQTMKNVESGITELFWGKQ